MVTPQDCVQTSMFEKHFHVYQLQLNIFNIKSSSSKTQLYVLHVPARISCFIDNIMWPLWAFSSFDEDQLANGHPHCRNEHLKICSLSKASKNMTPQSCKILQTFCMVGKHELVPTPSITNVCRILHLCWAISLLVFNKSLSNLATSMTLRHSFKRCRWIFANWCQSKLKRPWEGFTLLLMIHRCLHR